jgi:hypothetical protein
LYNYGDADDVERHAECVRGWLGQQEAFVLRRPFRLLADPKGQDQWSTYIEYLAFEAESLYVLVKAARRLERKAETRDGYRGKYRAANAAT